MARVTRGSRPVVHAEEIDDLVDELIAESRARGAEIRGKVPGLVYSSSAAKPSIDALLRELLREGIEDEIVPAVEPSYDGIADYERDREVMKKALVGLKMTALKEVARRKGLRVSASAEELAERVARAYHWDEEEIARLVLENEQTVQPDRGFSTRLFPLREAPDMDYVEDRLAYVQGRYIRIGVAKWFVFDDVEAADPAGYDLSGSLRAYEASIDNRIANEPRLHADTSREDALIRVRESDMLAVVGAKATTARLATRALAVAARVQTLGHVPFLDPRTPAVPGHVHDVSKFLLDLLFNRLPAGGLGDINLTVARFRMRDDHADLPWDAEVARRPVLKAVHIEGDHILASVPACRLLAVEQRALSDITVQVTVRDKSRVITGRFPMRITVDRDHIAIETSYGAGDRQLSAGVHAAAVTAVEAEINGGYGNEDRLNEFIAKIRERAVSGQIPDDLDELVTVERSDDPADDPDLQ